MPTPMIEHNHTPWSLDTIRTFPVIGQTVNQWRQRTVTLYEHPDVLSMVVTVGITFDQSMCVCAVEDRRHWRTALSYISQGKVYVSK